MKIALAQVKLLGGDLDYNLRHHLTFIHKAAQSGASAIFFPELSLSGYEPLLMNSLSRQELEVGSMKLAEESNRTGLLIGAGMPSYTHDGKCRIAMALFYPDNTRLIRFKQHLHEDELPYFIPGERVDLLPFRGLDFSIGICYESLIDEFLQLNVASGSSFYLASVSKHQSSVERSYPLYAATAKKFRVPVLMVNNVGKTDNFIAYGSSAVWDSHGNLLAALDGVDEGIVFFSTDGGAYLETII